MTGPGRFVRARDFGRETKTSGKFSMQALIDPLAHSQWCVMI